MSDIISRQAAIDALCDDFCGGMKGCRFYPHCENIMPIRSLPSAEPETAKRIVCKSRDGMTFWYQCDMCNEPVDKEDAFCRVCGRRLIDG